MPNEKHAQLSKHEEKTNSGVVLISDAVYLITTDCYELSKKIAVLGNTVESIV